MKLLLFTLALTLTTSAFAVCKPNQKAAESIDIKTIISGSETTGSEARKELKKSKPSVVRDQLGRIMFSESTKQISDVQSVEIEKDEIYSNSRIERYCSETVGQDNAKCVSFCARWTNYLSRP